MPDLLVVVAGTGTEVGKTWTTTRVIRTLRSHGVAVAARKPVQSYEPGTPDSETDAGLLATASGEEPERVCPRRRRFPLAMAPPIAARLLGRAAPTIADLTGELELPEGGVALVEGVGGPRSPLAEDGDTTSLARAIDADLCLLVAHPALGALNDILLAAGSLEPVPVVVFLNRFDASDVVQRKNLEWLRVRTHLEVLTDLDAIAGALEQRVSERERDGKVPPS